ncbi:MAG: hypothetical protein ABW192_04325 [Sphingobium sp.]
MATTFSKLRDVQLERLLALPAKFSDNPFRAWALSSLQQRNAALDALFYDVKSITEQEVRDLAFWLAREGAVIHVPPSGGPPLTVHTDHRVFLAEHGPTVGAVAIAGVGSSALGSAAFARNVADAIGRPEAAVVSGYGLADVVTEAMGGWFWFGGLNSARHLFERLDSFTKLFTKSEATSTSIEAGLVRMSKDTETLIALLLDPRLDADLLIGHSKGNLVVSEALYAIEERHPAHLQRLTDKQIVTVSAKVGMPPSFHRILDIMGEQDGFGAMNSRSDIPTDYEVPHAWHSTNPTFLGDWGLDVTKALQTVLPDFDAWLKPVRRQSPFLPDMPQIATALLAG